MSEQSLAEDGVFNGDIEEKSLDSDGQWEASIPGDGVDYEAEPESTPAPRKRGEGVGLFSKIPRHLFGGGLAQKLGPSACVLYIALCEHGNRHGCDTFKASDKTLAWETALSPRTIKFVRGKLLENGLVQYSREPGQNYTYFLVRQKLAWLKKEERLPRPKRKPRGMVAARQERQP